MSVLKQIKSALSSLTGTMNLMSGDTISGDTKSDTTERSDRGMNRRNACAIHPGTPQPLRPWADNKAVTKARLIEHGLPVPPTYAVVSSVGEISAAWETVRSLDRFVVKPTGRRTGTSGLTGTGGRTGNGILVLQRALDHGKPYWKTPSGRQMGSKQIRRHMADLVSDATSSGVGQAMIEYRVRVDDTFHQIYPRGLTDIRVITQHGTPVLAMACIPTDEANGRANLQHGALGTSIDINSGVMSAAHDEDGYLAEHPDTYASIEGVKIKSWNSILDICMRAADAVPLDDLAVDLVIDADAGPMIMNINASSGLDIQNIRKQGMRSVLHDV